MRSLNLPALTVIVTIILLVVTIAVTFVSCEKQQLALPVAAAAAQPAAALPNFTALVRKEGPAVINISKNILAIPGIVADDPYHEFFGRFAPGKEMPREFRSQSLGSGFIISKDGYILTNAHVVEEVEEITVRLTDQREFKATLTGTDWPSDIALLKIPATDLPVATIGDSSKLDVGEWVVAIGSPFGFGNSVSQGIVSAKGRSLPGDNLIPFIQTDVPVNQGNSGGPLFNMGGEVVGINTQIYNRSGAYVGLSFVIPIDLAMKVRDELMKHGVVRRGKLGATLQSVSPEHAKSFGLDKAGGALVTSVEKNGPADLAGVAIGDIILKYNGKELANMDELVREVSDAAPGSIAKLRLWHRGASREVNVSLGLALDDRIVQTHGIKREVTGQLGLALRELLPDEQRALHTEGVLLVVEASGIATRSGIQSGDILQAVNSQQVSGIAEFRSALAKAGKRVAVLVQREGAPIYIALKLGNE